nr:recombinase family protein [uncultured Allomuricauda sp.]
MLAIYTRLSSDDDKGNSIENQIREGKQFASKNGFKDNYEIYDEGEGVSGRKDLEDRPILFQLVKDIRAKKIKAVWFRHQNRLDRNSLTFHLFADEVKKAKARVFFSDKEENFNDPSSMFHLGMMSLISSYQADLTGVQVRKVLKDNVREGKVVGGIPFGYRKGKDKKLEVCPKNSLIVKKIFEDYLSGIGTPTIARDLNNQGVQTLSKNTKKWIDSTILYILKNEHYIGNREYGGQVFKVPAIVDKSTFKKVQKKIADSGTKKGKKTKHKYLLNGLIACGCCGKDFLGRSYRNKGYSYYKCNSQRYPDIRCSNRAARKENLDDLIWNTLFEDAQLFDEVKKMYRQGDSHIRRKELLQEKESLEAENLKLQERINRIKDGYDEGFYTVSETKKRIGKVENLMVDVQEKLERTIEQLNSITNERKLIEDLRRDFPWLSGGENREAWEKEGILLDADTVNELRIKASVGFNEKQKILKKYIRQIVIRYSERDNLFVIDVAFKLPIQNKILKLKHNLGRKPKNLIPRKEWQNN